MKKSLLTGAAVLSMVYCSMAQQEASKFIPCSSFSITQPLSELAKQYPASEEVQGKAKDDEYRSRPRNTGKGSRIIQQDPVLQSQQGVRALTAPIVNFDGTVGNFTPPDPSGAAGPNHYVQAVNCAYRIYDKTGKALINALNLSKLWSGSADDGDPIVLYDRFADRWFIQQFQQTGNKILIAISTTADPTGTYYTYTFVPDSKQFPDYPKFSIWWDGYYGTYNYGTQKISVFERDKMLKGDQSAGMIVTAIPSSLNAPNNGFFSPLTLDADGQLPPNGTPNYLVFFHDDNQVSSTKDEIVIAKIATDWKNKSATLSLDTVLATEPFNSYFTGGTMKDIAQPSSSTKLDALDGFFAYRAPYFVWTGYSSLMLCNAVNLGNKVAGIRWYELRRNSSTQKWSIYQQGTYGPSDGVSRWVPSIAMDKNGSIALAYAVCGSTNTYAGLRYTGRLASDPLGQMTFAEQTAVTGTSALSSNRFGDYSQTSLDPDGITFWHTSEYGKSGQKTRIFSFQITTPTDIASNSLLSELTAFQNGENLNVSISHLISDELIFIDLFDLQGKYLTGKSVASAASHAELQLNVSGFAKGVYLLRVGNLKFQKVIKITIQ
jgi:hypothetical protein